MHQHYVTRALGKEGQALSARGMNEYLSSIILLPSRHLDSAPNFASFTNNALQLTLYLFRVPYNHGSHTPLHILTDR